MKDVESFTVAMQCVVYLEFESLGLLPGEALVGEVSVLCSLEVDGLGQVELLHNDTRSQIEVVVDDFFEFIRGPVGGTVRINVNGKWLSNTNGV